MPINSTISKRGLPLLAMLAVLSASVGGATDAEPVICDQPYALCGAAKCIPHPRDPGRAICTCDNFDGDSAGLKPCDERAGTTAENGTRFLVSTFSFENTPAFEMTCPADSFWSNCVDQPCTVDPRDSSRSICSCPIERPPQEGIITLGCNCDTSTCSNSYWSAALLGTGRGLQEKLAEKLDINPEEAILACGAE